MPQVQPTESPSFTDDLTGAYVRRYFEEQLAAEVRRSQRFGFPFSLLLCDIDGFQEINDRHGHAVGDEVLRHVAWRLARTLRDVDVIARYGGDEFVLILPHTDVDAALPVAERLREVIAYMPVRAVDLEVPVTASLGLAAFPDRKTETALLAAAEEALKEAKTAGRNRVAAARATTAST